MGKKTTTKETDCCSFCGSPRSEVGVLFAGSDGACICDQCIERGHSLLEQSKAALDSKKAKPIRLEELMRPADIKAFLDQYVIGQDEAKRHMAVAVYNHYKRLMHEQSGEKQIEIDKSNILMVGPTGTGKTLMARTIAKLLKVPFTIVDATVLTEAGYVGEDVESILSRLLQAADYDVALAERGIVFIDEIDKIARRLNTQAVGYGQLRKERGDTDDIMQYVLPQDLKSFGLIPELIGRIPVLTYLEPLDRAALRSILTEPKNAIVRQYVKLFEMDGIALSFDDDALDYIVDKAVEYRLGARGLRSICEAVMMDSMFELPSRKNSKKSFTVTLDYARSKIDNEKFRRLKAVS